jgi:hypothetical protein
MSDAPQSWTTIAKGRIPRPIVFRLGSPELLRRRLDQILGDANRFEDLAAQAVHPVWNSADFVL